MAVLVQRQLAPDLSFVLHTRHPGEPLPASKGFWFGLACFVLHPPPWSALAANGGVVRACMQWPAWKCMVARQLGEQYACRSG